MNSNEDFLRNELIWLASIRCEIIENDSYIIVTLSQVFRVTNVEF